MITISRFKILTKTNLNIDIIDYLSLSSLAYGYFSQEAFSDRNIYEYTRNTFAAVRWTIASVRNTFEYARNTFVAVRKTIASVRNTFEYVRNTFVAMKNVLVVLYRYVRKIRGYSSEVCVKKKNCRWISTTVL